MGVTHSSKLWLRKSRLRRRTCCSLVNPAWAKQPYCPKPPSVSVAEAETGGACCPFDLSSPEQLRRLLGAVAAFASGGRKALANYADDKGGSARLLDGDLLVAEAVMEFGEDLRAARDSATAWVREQLGPP